TATSLLGPTGVQAGTAGRVVATGATHEQVPTLAPHEDVVSTHAVKVVAAAVPDHFVVRVVAEDRLDAAERCRGVVLAACAEHTSLAGHPTDAGVEVH